MELRMTDGLNTNGWPFAGWRSVLGELDSTTPRSRAPRADVVENEAGYHFYFEMPGIKADSIDARMEDGALVVEAERKRPEWTKESSVHVSERTYGKLLRAFELPEDAAHDNIAASYRDGVLEVTVPKRPESKPLKIKVQYEN